MQASTDKMWSDDLARLQYFNPAALLASSEEDQRACSFVLALALFSNDAKVLLGLAIRMTDMKPNIDRICEEYGEYSGQWIYLHRLIYSHLHELHYLFMQHYKIVSQTPLFRAAYRQMSRGARLSWDSLVSMALDKDDKMKIWLKDVRDCLGFHYVRHAELYAGYRKWAEELKPGGKSQPQEGAYISPGDSVKTTRYYFADGAADALMGEEIKKLPPGYRSLEKIMERNVRAISGFINGFLRARGADMKFSKYPPLKRVEAKSSQS